MDTLDNNISNDGVEINSQISNYLKETAKWTNFLSVVGFVMIGFNGYRCFYGHGCGVHLFQVRELLQEVWPIY